MVPAEMKRRLAAVREWFGGTVNGTIAVSLGLVLGGVLIMVFGPSIVTDDDAEPAILNVGSVVLSIGLISFAYEVYLRATFTRELLSLVGLQAHLSEVGVRRVQADNDLNWSSLIDGSSDFRVLVAEPLFWVQQHLPRVIAQGRINPVRVRLYFPDPGGNALRETAKQCGIDPSNLQTQVLQSVQELKQQWTDAATSGDPLQSGSELTLWYFDEVPGVSLFVADSLAVLIARAVVGRRSGDLGVAVTFDAANGFSVPKWLVERAERLDPTTPVWSRDVP
jgi:hypothetical protein